MDKSTLKKLHESEVKVLDEIVRVCNNNDLRYFLMGGTLLGSIRHKGFIPWDDDLDIAMPREDYEKFLEIAPKELYEDFELDDISINKKYWLIFAKVRLKNSHFTEKNYNKKYNGPDGIWVDIFPIDYTTHKGDFFINKKGKMVMALKSVYFHRHNYKMAKKKKAFVLMSRVIPMRLFNRIIKRKITSENKKDCPYIINYGSQYGVKRQTHDIKKIFPLKQGVFEGKKYNIPNDTDYVLSNIYGKNYMELPPIEKRKTHNPQRIVFEDGEEVIFDEKI